MTLLGLTGGIAMGKSTVANLLRNQGFPVVDTDDLARELVEPGLPAFHAILTAFGPAVRHSNGRLDRAALARIVFEDPAARRRLEAILHPPIQQRWVEQAAAWRTANLSAGVVVIPLLFETDSAPHFDATLCVACTAHSQAVRAAARGWSPAAASTRIAAQWPIERKIAAATHVLWTEGDLELTRLQLDRVLRQLNLQPAF
jgi:dephospho-CoA kinase